MLKQLMYANWPDRFANMLNITVRSSSGHDITLDTPVLHGRHIGDASSSSIPIANDRHEKQIVSTPQLTGFVAPFSAFSHSICQATGPDRTPQTYIFFCQHPDPRFGNDDCQGCNTVGFSPVPAGTTAINLVVWLAADVSAAQLYYYLFRVDFTYSMKVWLLGDVMCCSDFL